MIQTLILLSFHSLHPLPLFFRTKKISPLRSSPVRHAMQLEKLSAAERKWRKSLDTDVSYLFLLSEVFSNVTVIKTTFHKGKLKASDIQIARSLTPSLFLTRRYCHHFYTSFLTVNVLKCVVSIPYNLQYLQTTGILINLK